MRFYFYLLLLCVCVSSSRDKEEEDDIQRKRILEHLTKTRTVLAEGYQLVSRQLATDVYMFRSYRTVSVVFYKIEDDISDARFSFQVEELHMNAIGSCAPQDVIINIKRGSYPAVNPDGYDFPKDFVDTSTRDQIHTLEMKSDGANRTYSIENPRPGNWYALIYKKWEDPRTQKVEQQGLVAVCQTILYTDLQVKKHEDIQLKDCYSILNWSYADLPSRFKCMSYDNNNPISLRISVIDTDANSGNISLRVQAKSMPTEDSSIVACSFDPAVNGTQTITFYPHPNTWHYVQIDILPENFTRIADCESFYLRTDMDEVDNHTIDALMRDDKGRFFTYDYGLPTTDLQDATSLINLTASEVKSVRFDVNQFLDIGGTITLEASLLMSLKYYMGYKRNQKNNLLGFTDEDKFFRVVICLDIDHTSVPLDSGVCKYNDVVKPALFVLNSTDSDSIYEKVLIPYPESGSWFLTMRLFCDSVVCPCYQEMNGTYYVDLKGNKTSDSMISVRDGESVCNATVVLSISSTSCVGGRCSGHGNCLLNTVGGLVMSFCSCSSGYGGWDCSDDSRIDSQGYMLASVLLLTLSNIPFFVSTYVAIIRLYYTEALIYTFTMVFSTFYHACDAPLQVQYCIARGSLLQFGDFYCGLMSFWVTLLAMSIMDDKHKSIFQLTGAIVIALLTTWNMHSFVAFLLPVAVGVFLVFVSWYMDWRKIGVMLYSKSYYRRYFPLGLVLVSVGLICYAFLQTEQNYRIVHSLWHMIIALSVVFLLPDVKRGDGVNPFLPSSESCRLPFCRLFNRNDNPISNNDS